MPARLGDAAPHSEEDQRDRHGHEQEEDPFGFGHLGLDDEANSVRQDLSSSAVEAGESLAARVGTVTPCSASGPSNFGEQESPHSARFEEKVSPHNARYAETHFVEKEPTRRGEPSGDRAAHAGSSSHRNDMDPHEPEQPVESCGSLAVSADSCLVPAAILPASSLAFGAGMVSLTHSASFWRGCIFCELCGSYASGRPSNLGRPCPGMPSAGGKHVLSRLRRGLAPKDVWPSDESAVPPSGISRRNPAEGAGLEQLRERVDRNAELAASRRATTPKTRRTPAW